MKAWLTSLFSHFLMLNNMPLKTCLSIVMDNCKVKTGIEIYREYILQIAGLECLDDAMLSKLRLCKRLKIRRLENRFSKKARKYNLGIWQEAGWFFTREKTERFCDGLVEECELEGFF